MRVTSLSGISRNAGGVFYAVSSLCKGLRALGVDITALGNGAEFSAEDRAVWDPVPVMPFKALGPLATGIGLRKRLLESNADLVHQHGLWLDDQWAALHWQKRTGRPVIVSPHGMLDPWALKNSGWKKKLVGVLFAEKSLHEATCLHALCRSEANSIRAYGLTNPIAIIPNGIELPELEPPGFKPTSNEKRKLLFLGRLHPKKGIVELLRAWGGFASGWKLLVAGWDDGGHEAELKELATRLGLDGRVEFIGAMFGNAKDQLLRSVDAFILPSFSEGLPMSVLEAWSYGLPVIMTDFCNLPEGFEAKSALRAEPNQQSILKTLEQIASMGGKELTEMGLNGRALVEKQFTWAHVSGNLKQVYEWCLNGGDLPSCMVMD